MKHTRYSVRYTWQMSACKLALAACLSLAAHAAVHAQVEVHVQAPTSATLPPAPSDPAHLAAVADMLRAARIGELLMAGMRVGILKERNGADMFAFVAGKAGPVDLERLYVQPYARYVSAAEARHLTASLRKPGAVMLGQSVLDQIGGAKPALRTAAEQKAIRDFEASADAARLLALFDLAKKEGDAALVAWIRVQIFTPFSKGFAALAAYRARVEAAPGVEPVPLVMPQSGDPAIDGFMGLVGDATHRQVHRNWRFESDLGQLGLIGLATPARLVDHNAVRKSLEGLTRAEEILEVYLRDVGAMSADFGEAFKRLALPGGEMLRKGAEEGFERNLTLALRRAENQRALLDILRNVLLFVQSRKPGVELYEGRVSFATDAEAATYNGMVADLERENEKSAALIEESRKELDKVTEMMR